MVCVYIYMDIISYFTMPKFGWFFPTYITEAMAPGRCYRSSGGDNNGVTPNQRTTMRTSPGLDGWILLVSGPWNLLSVVGVIHWHKCGNSMIACSKTSHESGYNPCNINYGMSYTVSVHDCIYLSIELEQHRQVIHVFFREWWDPFRHASHANSTNGG